MTFAWLSGKLWEKGKENQAKEEDYVFVLLLERKRDKERGLVVSSM
jgi:hypothetical protein